MSDTEKNRKYELVFEGPGDQSPDTLRKLKGVMIADLELSIPEVQHILESAPLTIKRSDDQKKLSVYANALLSAGAKVLLVTREVPKLKEPPAEEQESVEFEINLDQPEELEDPEPKVFSLDFDPDNAPEEDATADLAEEPTSEDAPLFNVSLVNKHGEEIEKRETKSDLFALKDESESFELKINQADTETPPPVAVPTHFELSVDSGAPDERVPEKPAPVVENTATKPAAFEFSLELADEPAPPKAALPKPPAAAPKAAPTAPLEFDLSIAEEESVTVPSGKIAKEQPEDFDLDLTIAPEEPAQAGTVAKTVKSAPPPAPPVEEIEAKTETKAEAPAAAKEARELTLAELQRKKRQEAEEKAEAEKEGFEEIKTDQEFPASVVPERRHGLLEILGPLLVGVSLLAVGNWIYFSVLAPGSKEDGLSRLEKSISIFDEPVVEKVEEKAKAPDLVRGAKTGDALSGTWELDISDAANLKLTVTLSTPKPADLTPEEIISNVKQQPWLRKVQIEQLKIDPDKASGDFKASTTVRAYIDYAGQSTRILAPAEVAGNYDVKKKTLRAEISGSFSAEGIESQSAETVVKVLGPSKFGFRIKTSIGSN